MGSPSVLTVSPTGSSIFSGSIQGSGTLGTISLVMNGPGTQVLAGSNSYTGGTTINAGTLLATSPASLPGYSTSATVTVGSGATLAVPTGSGTTGWSNGQIGTVLGKTTWSDSTAAFGIDTTNSVLGFTYTQQHYAADCPNQARAQHTDADRFQHLHRRDDGQWRHALHW